MLAVVGIVLFACGTKDSEDSLEIKNISAHDKAMEIAGTAQKESEKGNKRHLSQDNINQDIENQEKGIEIINKKMEAIKMNKNHNSKKSLSQDKK